MTQLDRHTFPNGGWFFRQPQTAWVNPMAMVSFNESVKAIVKHRLANKAITAKHGLSTDPRAVGDELERYTRIRLGIPLPAPPSFFQQSRSPSQNAEGAAAGDKWYRPIARTTTGIVTLADWLGRDGKPVAKELSEARATQCIACPKHGEGDFLSLFTRPIADLIRRQYEERKQLKLSTSKDDTLNYCTACECPLKLKVHVPVEYIRKHIKQPELDKLVPECWILREP